MLELWTRVVERNEFPPPSSVSAGPEIDREEEHQALLRRLVSRFALDLPGPLPSDLFDSKSALAASRLVAASLGRLRPGTSPEASLARAVEEVPIPGTPAEHVTQAALFWFAIPIARRLESQAFRAANQGAPAAEHAEAVGDRMIELLAARPLLSFREDCEEFFARGSSLHLGGIEECLGTRRWIVQRLASEIGPGPALARRGRLLRKILEKWKFKTVSLREILLLREAVARPMPGALLSEFLPLLAEGGWPEDLAPRLRRQALALREAMRKEADDPDPSDA